MVPEVSLPVSALSLRWAWRRSAVLFPHLSAGQEGVLKVRLVGPSLSSPYPSPPLSNSPPSATSSLLVPTSVSLSFSFRTRWGQSIADMPFLTQPPFLSPGLEPICPATGPVQPSKLAPYQSHAGLNFFSFRGSAGGGHLSRPESPSGSNALLFSPFVFVTEETRLGAASLCRVSSFFASVS